MDETLVPIIVAILGLSQIALSIYFARRHNEASADKDDALAMQAVGRTYSTLLQDMTVRVESLEERCEGYEDIIAKLELKCAQYEAQLEALDL